MSRRILVCLAILVLIQTTGCVIYPIRAEIQSHETATVNGLRRLAVETRNGEIAVRCNPASKDVAINATRRASGLTEEEARTFAEKIEIHVDKGTSEPGVMRVSAEFPASATNRNLCAAFEIVMPPSADLDLVTSNGLIIAEGCEKDVSTRTSNGRIKAASCKGNLHGHTSNGTIEARDVGGDVDVQTSNGAIELNQVGRNSIRAITTNGHIHIVDSRGAATLHSSNGSVTLRCSSLPSNPAVEVVTSNGHVDVELPNSVKADLAMNTSNGRVSASLSGAQVSDMESGRTTLHAKLNGGGGRVDIRSSNGSVAFRTRDTASPTQGTR